MPFLGVHDDNALLVGNSGQPCETFVNWAFDRHCQLVNRLQQVVLAKTLAQGAVPSATVFCFVLSDEKLLGRFWVLIHIGTFLRRVVATTL
jgi:hypothetical protein